jgi:hypothetical protein
LEKAIEGKGEGEVGDARANEREKKLFHVDLLNRPQKLGDIGEKSHDEGERHEAYYKEGNDHEDFTIGLAHSKILIDHIDSDF